MSKDVKSEDIEKTAQDAPLGNGELTRIIITQYEDGSINSSAKVKGKDEKLDVFNILGVIDTAKFEIQSSITRSSDKASAPKELADQEVIFDEIDEEMDITGQMKIMGVSSGSKVMVTKSEAKLRTQVRAAFIAEKENKKK